jgi:hypothetical protein
MGRGLYIKRYPDWTDRKSERRHQILRREYTGHACAHLKASLHNIVLREIEPFKNNPPNDCAVNLYGYISNNIKNIDYAAYQKKVISSAAAQLKAEINSYCKIA